MGSECYSDAEFRETIEAIADGRLGMAPLAPVDIGFDQVVEAIEALANGSDHTVKVSMTMAS